MRTPRLLTACALGTVLALPAACALLPPQAEPLVAGAAARPAGPVPADVKKVIHGSPSLEYVGLKNPLTPADPRALPATDPHIVNGKELYERYCAACHGDNLKGDGPEAKGFPTPIPPADLTDPESLATLDQGYVFWRISDGGQEPPFLSVMPAWKKELTETERWQLTLYLYKAAGVSPKAAQ